MSWGVYFDGYCAQGTELGCTSYVSGSSEFHLTNSAGGDVIWPGVVLYQGGPVEPVLQLQDGTYVGQISSSSGEYMVKFTATGQVLNLASGGASNAYYPQIATADGGVIASPSSVCNPSGCVPGPAPTFDSNLNLTGQMASLPIQSWLGNAYRLGTVDQLFQPPILTADDFSDFAGGDPSQNSSADPNAHVVLTVFNLYKNSPGDIQSDSTVTTKVNNARSFWSTITKGRLSVDWNGIVRPAKTCDPVAYPSGCGAFPLKDLDEITSVVTATELARRFCNASALPLCLAGGIQLVFTADIAFSGAPAQGYTPNTGPRTSPQFMNISVISGSALEDGSSHDVSHELGHIFQLRHIGWSLPSNLMCTGMLPWIGYAINVCPTHAGGRLGTDQIQDSERGARRLQ